MNENLYRRVLSQFERYAGTDDCIDLRPVHDVTDEIERFRECIRKAITHLRTIVEPYEAARVEDIPFPVREFRLALDELRKGLK